MVRVPTLCGPRTPDVLRTPHGFLLDPDDETGLSFDGLNLNGNQFLAAYRGNEDRIVTILLGVRTDGQQVPTVKLTVAQT